MKRVIGLMVIVGGVTVLALLASNDAQAIVGIRCVVGTVPIGMMIGAWLYRRSRRKRNEKKG